MAAALDAAAAQARRYRAGLEARYGDGLRLRCYAVVAVGFLRLVAREVPRSPEPSGGGDPGPGGVASDPGR